MKGVPVVSDEVVGMMIAGGEQVAESARGEMVRDALDAPRPAPTTWESIWVPVDARGRGYWLRRRVGDEEWERVG
jgi:hypothetical protein